jgi:hypothetical protein
MICKDCKKIMPLEVCMSQAGYYIGRQCDCGPYERVSGYFPARAIAEEELQRIRKGL